MLERYINTFTVQSLLGKDEVKSLIILGRELSPQHNEGQFYQQRFEAGLDRLIAKGRIDSWEATQQYSPDDCDGIDYWVNVGEKRVPYQLKGAPGHNNSKRARRLRELKARGIPIIYAINHEGLIKEEREFAGEAFKRMKKYLREAA